MITKLFLKTLCVEFQYLPRNNGRHLPKIPPPLRKKRKSSTIARSLPLSPLQSQRHNAGRLEETAGRERGGGVTGKKGWEEGEGVATARGGRRQNNRRGKVTKSRANGKTLTIDMNEDVPIVSRDEEKSSQLAFFFFFLTRHQHCTRFPRLIEQ